MLEIVDYVNTLSPQAAFNLYDEILEGIRTCIQLVANLGQEGMNIGDFNHGLVQIRRYFVVL